MVPIYHDPTLTDDTRRDALYRGALVVTSPTPASGALCEFARALLADAFGGLDPEHAQYELPVERFAAVLAELKPRFIHHPESKRLVRAVLDERGCDLELTHFDVPRLRSSTSDGYLTTGIAYAWHPHRDTWYSAPHAQLNFWMPVFDIEPGNAMAFHIDHFDRPVENTSSTYNYYVWNQVHRAAAASNIGTESRPLPGPIAPIPTTGSITLVSPVGGLLEFSGQHLHSSVPNATGKTRYSIDFRTVHLGDMRAGRSAPNVDSACTGSSIRDYIKAADFSPMPDDVVHLFDDGTEAQGDLTFAPVSTSR